MQVSLFFFLNAKEKHGDASFSFFFFNAKENIQQNIYTSKCVINLILALNPDALLWN